MAVPRLMSALTVAAKGLTVKLHVFLAIQRSTPVRVDTKLRCLRQRGSRFPEIHDTHLQYSRKVYKHTFPSPVKTRNGSGGGHPSDLHI